MWREAGCYDVLYMCDGIEAGDIVGVLRYALRKMNANPGAFEELAPSNGWGTFDGAKEFLEKLIAECDKHPDAIVRVSK